MKATVFFPTFAAACLLAGCAAEPENTNIPTAQVSFIIAPTLTGADNTLAVEGNSRLYDDMRPAVLSSGYGRYGYAGVIVTRAYDGELYAFDAACTHEASREAQLQPDGYLATCPVCGSSFETGNGSGYVMEGSKAEQVLKRYRVRQYGSGQYKVTNN